MKKLIILLLALCMGCAQRGCTDHQKIRNHQRPFIVVSKPPAYSFNNNCYITLSDRNGEMFTLEESEVACGMCVRYNIGDTLR